MSEFGPIDPGIPHVIAGIAALVGGAWIGIKLLPLLWWDRAYFERMRNVLRIVGEPWATAHTTLPDAGRPHVAFAAFFAFLTLASAVVLWTRS